MSTSQVQAALVALIRYPELNRGEALEAFLDRYDLTPKEQWQVRSLATSYYVNKFGRDQRGTRFDLSVRGSLPLTVRLVGTKILARDIYGIRFEPKHEGLAVGEMSRAFARFFIDNAPTFVTELGIPSHAGDVARYELAEFEIKGPTIEANWKPPANSLLRPDTPLLVEDFDHDVVSYVEAARKRNDEALAQLVPEKRPTTVLFARVPKGPKEAGFYSKQFEIDDTLKRFFAEQRDGGDSAELPSCYQDLVSLGICRPLL